MKNYVVVVLGLVLLGASGVYAEEVMPVVDSQVAEAEAMHEVPEYCPVCGPHEEMEDLMFQYKHEGKKYSFCSIGCLKAFKENPEKFLEIHGDGDPHIEASPTL